MFQRVPAINASIVGGEVRLLESIDISVAVATPNGLITPIIKDAVGLGVEGISTTLKVRHFGFRWVQVIGESISMCKHTHI